MCLESSRPQSALGLATRTHQLTTPQIPITVDVLKIFLAARQCSRAEPLLLDRSSPLRLEPRRLRSLSGCDLCRLLGPVLSLCITKSCAI